MGLLNNNYRDSFGTTKFYGTTVSNGSYPYINTPSTVMPGASRNIFASDAGIDPLSSKPAGARHPIAFQMPQKAGGLASRNNTHITLAPTGTAVGGKPTSGSADITFTTTATGGLIVSGSGSASITLSPTGTILSVAAGSGSATITMSGSALIGALAGLSGQSSITLSPTAVIAAVGYLSGLSTNETEFSEAALARAVWTALQADYLTAGTMGAAMAAAGSAGDPWQTSIPASYTGTQAGKILADLAAAYTEPPTALEVADAVAAVSTEGAAEGTLAGDVGIAKKLTANDLTRVGDTVTIKENDQSSTFRQYTSTDSQRAKL